MLYCTALFLTGWWIGWVLLLLIVPAGGRLDIFERRMRTGQQTTWTLTEGGALAKDAQLTALLNATLAVSFIIANIYPAAKVRTGTLALSQNLGICGGALSPFGQDAGGVTVMRNKRTTTPRGRHRPGHACLQAAPQGRGG